MNKTELQAELTKRGIPFDESATNAVLSQLLKEATDKEAPAATDTAPEQKANQSTAGTESPPPPAEAPADDVSWRIAAGLTREQAEHAAANQREWDARAAG